MTTQTQTIAQQVADFDAGLAEKAPAQVLVFDREQADLTAAGVPEGAVTAGTALPDADLTAADGSAVGLHDLLGGRPAVVVFYRGAWCPYCNIALATYQAQVLPTLTESGIALVAISPQLPGGVDEMTTTNGLAFPVLSDPSNALAGQLGIVTAPTADAQEAQGTLGIHVAPSNADGTAGVPMPAVLVVGADGTITFVDVHPDYTTRTEPEAILAAVAQLP